MMMKLVLRMRGRWRREDGSSLVELALVTPMLMVILMACIDFSRAYFLSIEVAGAAHAGAAYGMQNQTDTAGMRTAAVSDAPDVPGLSIATPTYGCECSDGSASSINCSSPPSCTYNMVNWVKVKATANYSPLFPWPGIPSSITISNSATMRSGS